jgi:alpha-L-arabinofuranosidase
MPIINFIRNNIMESKREAIRKGLLSILCFVVAVVAASASEGRLREPDSVYLYSYATDKNGNHNGLHFAWSVDKKTWFPIGNDYGFLRSDFGRWGAEKRMITPFLFQAKDGEWHCVFSLNDHDNYFAHAASRDLVDWGRQSYTKVIEGSNVLKPVISFDAATNRYQISYATKGDKFFRVTTNDFKSYSIPVEISASAYHNPSVVLSLTNGDGIGQVHYVPFSVVDKLMKSYEVRQYKAQLHAEHSGQDNVRFAGLKPVDAKISVRADDARPISPMLIGVFFEDLNYAADGGLYAELVQNRDFEYRLTDKEGRDVTWNSQHSWSVKGNLSLAIDSVNPVHRNNLHYGVLQQDKPGGALMNSGFDGIVLRKGEAYNISFFGRRPSGSGGKLLIRLVDNAGNVLSKAVFTVSSSTWKTYQGSLVANADEDNARLELEPLATGTLHLDMISLFPKKTFKGRSNGLRPDLAQTIADIHPRFVRFPGGCVAHGDGLGNIYRWENTIGPLESRKPQRNLWGYHQTAGLGYFEYFQFCEDIGAEPVPVVAAGVPCQNSGTGGPGQQGGMPLNEMDEYIQSIFDLVEYANGDANTTWGRKRAQAGHPKPFNLKYIGIGNEDLITDIFEERFTMIFQAMKKKYPDITVIGTVGPASEGTDYREGWDIAAQLDVPMVDEHYYQPPGWFVHNQEFYDRYDRSRSKVYLGEYAAHLPGQPNNIETALAEALYLTSVERNGDVVAMASYAPLLAKEGHTQWNPDLIYFTNKSVKPTVGYHVQKLFGTHAGDQYLPVSVNLADHRNDVVKRVAYSVVRDSKSGDVILKMVNMLPVAVKPTVDLKGIDISDSPATQIVLKGDPGDRSAVPVSSSHPVAEALATELPPYSFTVIRIKTGKAIPKLK